MKIVAHRSNDDRLDRLGHGDEVHISKTQLLYPSITCADRLELISLNLHTVHVPEGIAFLFIIGCEIQHLILSSTVQIFGVIPESESETGCIVKHITLNENIITVKCPNCGIETLDSPFDFLPKLDDLDIRYNKIKNINFRTGYAIGFFVEGNEGIRIKYLYFVVNQDLGVIDPPTDYLTIVTDIVPTEVQGQYLLQAIESGETYIDIHKIFVENIRS